MRPLMTRPDLLGHSCAPLGSAQPETLRRTKRPLVGLPFGLGAVTLAVLGASCVPSVARAQEAAGLASGIAGAAPALAYDVVNGPTVTILSPHYNDQLKGATQVLVGVKAGKNTPRNIELYVDGRLASDPGTALPGYPSSNFTWDTSKFADGLHRLTVVITDTQGFRGGADVNVYINNNKVVDLTPPALEWMNVRQNETWRGLIDLQLKAMDNFGVKFLIISLNPASTPDKKPAAFSWFLNRPPYNIKGWDSRKAPDGLYSLRATAYDALENEGASPAVTIAINNHSINPTWKLPELPTDSVPTNRVNPLVGEKTGPASGADPNGPIELESDAPTPETTTELASPRVLSPRAETPRVAAASGRASVARPLVSAAEPQSDLKAVPSTAPASTWGGHSLRDNERVAALSVPPRALKRAAGKAALSRADMISRSSSSLAAMPAASPRSASVAPEQRSSVMAVDLRALKGDAPKTSARVAAATAAPRTPLLSSAPASGSRVAQAVSGAALLSREVSPASALSLARKAPMRLAAKPANAPSQPVVSSGDAARGQGSVAAPTFPSVDLSRRASAQAGAPRSSTPATSTLAMAPPAAVLKRAGTASITVAPALTSALPALHRALKGETLASVASRYKLPVAVLAMHNHMSEDAVLKAGQEIQMPQALAVSMAGDLVDGDVSSMMVGSVGVSPFRFLFEKQGGELNWDAANQRVTAKNSTHQVTLTIGSKVATVNQKEVMMDLAAFLVSGRTMVPLRFFEKALNASVEWEPATGRLLVAMAQ